MSRHPLKITSTGRFWEEWGCTPDWILDYIDGAIEQGTEMGYSQLEAIRALRKFHIDHELKFEQGATGRTCVLTILVSVEEEAQFRLIETA